MEGMVYSDPEHMASRTAVKWINLANLETFYSCTENKSSLIFYFFFLGGDAGGFFETVPIHRSQKRFRKQSFGISALFNMV